MSLTSGVALNYRADIDGLRAVAVLAVVLFHAGIGTVSGGYVGVDVFFVISGYLITSIITIRLARGDFSILEFYAGRVRRIFPALFAMVVTVSVAAFILIPPTGFKDFGESLLAASLFVSNIFFWIKFDYFDGPAYMKPLLHTWSLSVEEQFYVVFPVLLLALYKIKSVTQPRHALLVLLATSFAASLSSRRHIRPRRSIGCPCGRGSYCSDRFWYSTLCRKSAVNGLPRWQLRSDWF